MQIAARTAVRAVSRGMRNRDLIFSFSFLLSIWMQILFTHIYIDARGFVLRAAASFKYAVLMIISTAN